MRAAVSDPAATARATSVPAASAADEAGGGAAAVGAKAAKTPRMVAQIRPQARPQAKPQARPQARAQTKGQAQDRGQAPGRLRPQVRAKAQLFDVWLYRGAWEEWEAHEVEMAVPISSDVLEQKKQAIFRHQSQKDKAMFPGGTNRREFWQRSI